jgi:tetratricopeptide (TPR) repeat protein
MQIIKLSLCIVSLGCGLIFARQYRLDDQQLQLWNSPQFQKQFTESYIAETDIEPRVTVSERKQMENILELISSDKVDEAAESLSKYRGDTASAVFDFTLANIYFQQEKLDEAATAYRTAVDKYPKFRRAWRNLGVIYVRQNIFDKALPALTRVIELGGGDSTTFGLLGFAYSSSENHLCAESAYRMAILLDPETLDWKMGLARSFFRQQRYAEAVTICGQLINEYPERADLWLLQANAYIGLNEPLKAVEVYELLDHLGHSTAESLMMLGDIYINEEIYQLAVNSYIRALEKSPQDNSERVIRSAKALSARGEFDQTIRLIKAIEDAYGGDMQTQHRKDILKLRARIAVARGSGEEEAKVLEEIVELDPLDGEALILLGQHSARMGNNEKAIFYYERAANIEQHEADAKVRHAQLLVREGKYAEALPLLRRAQTINPRENIQKYLEQIERVAKTH